MSLAPEEELMAIKVVQALPVTGMSEVGSYWEHIAGHGQSDEFVRRLVMILAARIQRTLRGECDLRLVDSMVPFSWAGSLSAAVDEDDEALRLVLERPEVNVWVLLSAMTGMLAAAEDIRNRK